MMDAPDCCQWAAERICHVRFAMREIGLSEAIYSARALRPTRNRATAVSAGAAAARSI